MTKCPICKKGELEEKENEVTTMEYSNPCKLTVEASFEQCNKCKEQFFNEEQSLDFAKKLDKQLKVMA